MTPSCPACLNTNTSPVFSASASDSAQLLVIREGPHRGRHDALVSLIRDLWNGDRCEIRTCDDCGFGFAFPFVGGRAEFYNLAYPTVAYPASKWEFKKTIAVLNSMKTSDAKALEVAAGSGAFLDLCVPELFAAENVTATEFNVGSLSVLQAKGYNAVNADLRSNAFDARRGDFNFIFLFQVLEHLDDIDSLFGRLRFLSKPGGTIFIAVPNIEWIRFREEHGSLKDLPPIHIGRWTPASFDAIASRHGLAREAWQVEPFATGKFIRDDLLFTHFARAHRPGTVANKARSIRSRGVRLLAEAAEMIAFAPSRISPLVTGFKSRTRMGGAALWVQLKVS